MRYKKYLLITVALLCLLLSACGGRVLSEQEQSFRSALYTWCTRLDTMVYCPEGQRTDWDEASLAEWKEASALLREQTLSCETIDRHPGAKAFLLLITQYDQVLEAQPQTELLSLPPAWIHSVWYANEIIHSHRSLTEQGADAFLEAIEDEAATWLDRYLLGSLAKLDWPEPVDWTP